MAGDTADYTHVETVLPETVAVLPSGDALHRPARGPGIGPWCGARGSAWRRADPDDVHYLDPCIDCFLAPLEVAARDDESPVEWVGAAETVADEHSPPATAATDGGLAVETALPLGSVTASVVTARGGGRRTAHAPAADDTPACGESSANEYRRVSRRAVSTYPLCETCFAADCGGE